MCKCSNMKTEQKGTLSRPTELGFTLKIKKKNQGTRGKNAAYVSFQQSYN